MTTGSADVAGYLCDDDCIADMLEVVDAFITSSVNPFAEPSRALRLTARWQWHIVYRRIWVNCDEHSPGTLLHALTHSSMNADDTLLLAVLLAADEQDVHADELSRILHGPDGRLKLDCQLQPEQPLVARGLVYVRNERVGRLTTDRTHA